MRYRKVRLDAIGYELGPVVVSSAEIEERLAPAYASLHIPSGQLESLTGIVERRWWEEGAPLSKGAAAAAKKALARAGVEPEAIGSLIYAGVCREQFEPATACAVASEIGVRDNALIYDLSNACLGVLNGILETANRIELGQIRAGLVVSCESSREINEIAIEKLLSSRNMDLFKTSLATFTGGSGAVAVVLSDGSFGARGRSLRGGVSLAAPEHHRLCTWGLSKGAGGRDMHREFMATDSVSVLEHGVSLGIRTWDAFLNKLEWSASAVDRVICHQVGSGHKDAILKTLGVSEEKDFSTYSFLGNIGTVSLPMTAALAEERGFLREGDRVGFLGIGSGLNCMMLGWEW
ncbi:MAG: 3-oxoacyl-ACP synthase III [Elusimicrobia bacterium CG1_02_63_36]|nr:MAG: 3-oxoacyl-ACP synthase III [Elusimicrobia bacterium CG1_02_63_36]PIP82236.1 MAG: 3-oxoacyl-ACP synthase III [Elusimicrobia bacterium CG22_combo_CG10-13_8_21_14_all_63_91]PJA15345.1 MAG: 3-oxoacyl-ACP synthase III [Elusimicrobia bacterium CG_4_10_14_0_2_um_filter_63_34]PJB26970.1 MAG: 3-oxoacyl-ACP synthase III [Elusimicrobia bacterium CG_4_9_14_3_um_filter_62_55]